MKDFNKTAWLDKIGTFLLGVILVGIIFTVVCAAIVFVVGEPNEAPNEITPKRVFRDDVLAENIVVEGHTYLIFRIDRGGNAVHSPNCTCFKKLEKENPNADSKH